MPNVRCQVLLGKTDVFPNEEFNVKDGKTKLSGIPVKEMFRKAGNGLQCQTLRLDVFDAGQLRAGQTQPYEYGSFYVRQVSWEHSLSSW